MNTIKLNTIGTPKVSAGNSGGGGGGKELKRDDVNFFDYDGTLLYAYSWDNAKNLTELPPLPIHEGLEVREWNYTLEDIKAQGVFFIDVNGSYYIYDNIVTIDGVEYKKYVWFDENGERGEWCIIHKSSDAAEVDAICYWYYDDGEESYIDVDGDGNPYIEYITNTGNTIGKADVGACVYDSEGLLQMSNHVLIFDRSNGVLENEICDKILTVVSIPNTVTSLYRDVIYFSTIVHELKIPISVTYIASGYAAFTAVSVPSLWWNGINHEFDNFITSTSARRWEINENYSSINVMPTTDDLGYTYLKIAKTVADINYISPLNDRNNFIIIDFTEATHVPNLYEVNTYQKYTVYVVPDNLYEDWINASNWSSISDYIYKKSDCPFINEF